MLSDVPSIEMDKSGGGEGEIVPGELVSQDARVLEGPQPFLTDDLVVLMNIVGGREKDEVRRDSATNLDQAFQDVLTVLREVADGEAIYVQSICADTQDPVRFPDLRRQDILGESLRHRSLTDGEDHVMDPNPLFFELGQGAPAAQLTVISVGSQNENVLNTYH